MAKALGLCILMLCLFAGGCGGQREPIDCRSVAVRDAIKETLKKNGHDLRTDFMEVISGTGIQGGGEGNYSCMAKVEDNFGRQHIIDYYIRYNPKNNEIISIRITPRGRL